MLCLLSSATLAAGGQVAPQAGWTKQNMANAIIVTSLSASTKK
jgi:hypothetical protein